jgi:hypothetical protein
LKNKAKNARVCSVEVEWSKSTLLHKYGSAMMSIKKWS